VFALRVLLVAGIWLGAVVWADSYFQSPESLVAAVGVITAGCVLGWKLSHRESRSIGN
jgi:hypothetical protein